jgi:hypothetical protein
VESQKIRNHWEDQDVGWWTILKWILERWDEFIWIGLIWLNRDQWRALVNTVMNIWEVLE